MSARARAIDPSRWDAGLLRDAWGAATPFPHVVMDDVAPPAVLAELAAAFEVEDASRIQDEIFDVMASGRELVEPALRRFRDDLDAPDTRAWVEAVTGMPVARADARAFAYLEGHYLLPHADDDDGHRRVAYAFYVQNLGPLEGGELELFACTREGDVITETRAAGRIEPRPNRWVLFEVSPRSLHQVREVTAGGRLSIAGWFYR